MRILVTSGSQFLDIDAYGAAIAYAELLNVKGEEAVAVSTAPLNESITPSIRAWGDSLVTSYRPREDDGFVLVDVSESKFFDPIVDHDRIVGIIDHHTGFEGDWWERLGNNANIEFIGAACTLVYEAWQKAQKLQSMSVLSMRLLLTGILDNTLNFKAGVTTDRDRQAHAALMERAELPADWPAQYFSECQVVILADLEMALKKDTKTIVSNLNMLPAAFGQLVIWSGQEVLQEQAQIATAMAAQNTDWGVNLVSIEEGISYFLADNPETQAKMTKLLGITFENGIGIADRLWLRKELLQQAQLAGTNVTPTFLGW